MSAIWRPFRNGRFGPNPGPEVTGGHGRSWEVTGGYGGGKRRKVEERHEKGWKETKENEGKSLKAQGKWRNSEAQRRAASVGVRNKIVCKGMSFNGFKLRGWASHTLWQSFNGFKGFRGFRGFRGLKAGKRQAWTPIRRLRSHCCGLGVPVGVDRAEKKRWIWPWGSLCLRGWASQTLGQSFNGFKLRGWASHTLWQSFNSFKGFRAFRGLRAGKRQAWTPIRSLRSHCCGLGVPVGVDRAEEAIDVALGCLLAAIA